MKRQRRGHQAGERHVHPLDGIGKLVVPDAVLGQLLEHGAGVEAHAELPPELVQHVPNPDVLGLPEYPVAPGGIGYDLRVAAGGVEKGRIGASGQGAADLDVRYAMVHADYRDVQIAGQRPGRRGGDAEAGAEAGPHGEGNQVDVTKSHPRLVQRIVHDAGDDVGVMVGGLPGVEPSLLRPEHVHLVGVHPAVRIHYADAQGVGGPLYPESDHRHVNFERRLICVGRLTGNDKQPLYNKTLSTEPADSWSRWL